ncbi:I78 family peptidase inhibitor [Streptomyces sp. NPDC004610]|uniref:I78 family peptidase inhibitor n=1 Tax=unclassified Streptomyces TaxID=2593676 RepID=UPI0033BE01BF
MPRIPTPPTDPDDPTGPYVGLGAEAAERRARERGWTTVRALPPGAMITMEYRQGRLNFEVEGGRVKRAWKG